MAKHYKTKKVMYLFTHKVGLMIIFKNFKKYALQNMLYVKKQFYVEKGALLNQHKHSKLHFSKQCGYAQTVFPRCYLIYNERKVCGEFNILKLYEHLSSKGPQTSVVCLILLEIAE